MGSVSRMCVISNVSINARDDVVLFFITKCSNHNHGADGYCYSQEIWTPSSLPIYAKYNEYGAIEDADETVSNWNLNFFIKRLQEKAVANKDCAPETLVNLEKIFDVIHDNSLFIEYFPSYVMPNGLYPVGTMLAHRWAYDMLTEKAESYSTFTDISLQDMISQGVEFYHVLENLRERDKTLPEHDFSKSFMEYGQISIRHSEITNRSDWWRLTDDGFRIDGYNGFGIKEYRKLLIDQILSYVPVDDDFVMDVITEIAKYFQFWLNMESLGKEFSPLMTVVPRYSLNEMHQKLLNRSVEFLNKTLEEQQEGFEDD